MAPPGGRTAAAGPPPCSRSTCSSQGSRPGQTRDSSLDTRQGPWGRALFCFIKKKPIEACCPMCPVTGNVSGGQRGKREGTRPRKLLFVRQAGSSASIISAAYSNLERLVFSAPCDTGEVRGGRVQRPEKGRAPLGLLGGRAGAEALAKLSPALPAIPPPPRSPVQGAQWVRPALPCTLYHTACLAEAHLC